LRGGEVVRATQLLQEALDLWIAEPLAGLDARPFVPPARTALEGVRVVATIDHITALCACGQANLAAASAEKLVASQPFDEAAWEALMTALYHSGRSQDALDAFARARDLLREELGLDVSPRLVALQAAVLGHTLASPMGLTQGAATPDIEDITGLPEVDLVGRTELIAEVVTLLTEQTRLLTLHGLGGVGKTSLALAAAHVLTAQGSAVRFADISIATLPDEAVAVMCRSLGLEPGDDPQNALAAHEGETVLIVDNAEQVIDLGPVLAATLRRSRRLRFLVTSRSPLSVRGEQLLPVPPLSMGDGADDRGEAVALFVRRSAQVRPRGQDEHDLDAVAALCNLAGCLPLTIEMVAAKTRRMTAAQLLAQLDERRAGVLDLPGMADLPGRQRSLRVVLAWTVERMSDAALGLLRSLAPVRGPVSETMIRRLAHSPADVDDALDEATLAGLLSGPDSRQRYRLPVPVAEYLLETAQDAQRRVVDTVVGLADDATQRYEDRVAALLADEATVDTAVAVATHDREPETSVRLLAGLLTYWLRSGRAAEALKYADAVLTLEMTPAQEALALLAAGQCGAWVSRPDSLELLQKGLERAHLVDGDHRRLVVNSWCYLGSGHQQVGALDDAREAADSARIAALDDSDLLEMAEDFRSMIAQNEGDHALAFELGLRALDSARRVGDPYVTVDLLQRLSESLLELGRPADADVLLVEAFELARTTPVGLLTVRLLIMRALTDLALMRPAAATGSAAEAIRLIRSTHPDPVREGNALRTLAAALALAGDFRRHRGLTVPLRRCSSTRMPTDRRPGSRASDRRSTFSAPRPATRRRLPSARRARGARSANGWLSTRTDGPEQMLRPVRLGAESAADSRHVHGAEVGVAAVVNPRPVRLTVVPGRVLVVVDAVAPPVASRQVLAQAAVRIRLLNRELVRLTVRPDIDVQGAVVSAPGRRPVDAVRRLEADFPGAVVGGRLCWRGRHHQETQ